MKMKVLRRNDGKEFCYSEDTAHLAKRGDIRLIEVEIDPLTRKRKGEVDLSRLDTESTDLALREAIAKKWPHVAQLLDRPDLVRVALAGSKANDLPVLDTSRFDVETGTDVPGVDDVDVPVADGVDLPAVGADETTDEDADAPAEAPVDDEEVKKAVDPIESAVMAFEVRLREQPGREAVVAAAAEDGVTVELATKAKMIKQAVELFRANLVAAKGA